MATDGRRQELLQEARDWVNSNQCPLPLDLVVEMMGAGLDATTIENDLLSGDQNGTT
jgi:hypothetical protein